MSEFAITTFFSYKGGAGRSTTCLNTLPLLAIECEANENKPLLLLDTDIESAGMTYLLDAADKFDNFDVKSLFLGEEVWTAGAVGNSIQDHPLYQYFLPVGHKLGLANDKAIMFLGVNDKTQVDRGKLSGMVNATVDKFKRFCMRNRVVAAVMDSAAGDQLTANLSVESADNLVVCMRPTSQFRIGTFNYLERLATRKGSMAPRIILLPTVVPQDCEIDGTAQLAAASAAATAFLNGKMEGKTNVTKLDVVRTFIREDTFGINEVPRFKWQENVLYRIMTQIGEDNLAEAERMALGRYELLAQAIAEDD